MSAVLWRCARCGADTEVYATGTDLCPGCGFGALRVPSMAYVHEAEKATRERMLARGGTDRHLVRNGKT